MERKHLGIVTGLSGGDMLTVQGGAKEGEAPPMRELHLAYIETPKIATPHKKPEPFGFAAREFVRKLVIGKKVSFSVEYKLEEREYVNLTTTEAPIANVADLLIKEGLATVVGTKKPKEQEDEEEPGLAPRQQELLNLQMTAKAEGKGLWSKKPDVVAANTVNVLFSGMQGYDHFKVQDAVLKDAGVAEGIVEHIFAPTFYSVLLVKKLVEVRISLPYVINIPSGPKSTEEQKKLAKCAKAYAEHLVQQQNVTIRLGSYDTASDSFYGQMTLASGKDVAAELLANGHIKLVKQNETMDADVYSRLRLAMHEAQIAPKGLWKSHRGTQEEDDKEAGPRHFVGKVVEVHSGSSVTIQHSGTGEERRFFLAGVRAPQLAAPTSAEKSQPYAWEAKELLRKLLIGKVVEVDIEYTRTPGKGEDDNGDTKKKPMTFVSIVEGSKCANVEMVAAGLATMMNPRVDEVLSKFYAKIVAADKRARTAKLGIHSGNPNPPVHNYRDLIGEQNTKTLAYYQEHFEKNPRVLGVVDYCFSGIRVKLRVPDSECYIPFTCQGLQPLPQDKNVPEQQALFLESQRFARLSLLQREVEAQILSHDKRGNFFGVLLVSGQNYAFSALAEGYALVNTIPGRGPVRSRELYEQAEDKARKAQKGLWDPKQALALETLRAAQADFEPLDSKVTLEIVSFPNSRFFYAVYNNEAQLAKIEEYIQKVFDPTKAAELTLPVRVGTYCMALYSEDNKWYRGQIERVLNENSFLVAFIDYGSTEEVTIENLRKIDTSFVKDCPPLSLKIALAYLEVPSFDVETEGKRLRNIFQHQLEGKTLTAALKYKTGGVAHAILLLGTETDPMKSFNAFILKRGWAQLARNVTLPGYLLEWKDIQDKARSDQAGLWETNDLKVDDDES